MKIEFDPEKNAKNIWARGIPFSLAEQFELDTAVIWLDLRKDYGEPRFNGLGYIGDRLYCMVFTIRVDAIRVISLRKANSREIRKYANA